MKITDNCQRLYKSLNRRPAIVLAEVDKQLSRGRMELARLIRANAAKADSTLTNSIRSKRKDIGLFEVVAGANHARMVEEGTGPGGWVPTKSLEDWIQAKGISPNDPDMSKEDLVDLIQLSIFRKGTEARPFFRPSYEQMKPRLLQLVSRGAAIGLSS